LQGLLCSVADPDLVGCGPFWSDLDLDSDVWDRIIFRIRILALINDSISTFLVYLCCLTFWSMKILFRAYFHIKNFLEKSWPKIYYCQDSVLDQEPDPVKNRADQQHCFMSLSYNLKDFTPTASYSF
jgi:hypothetical protein